MIGIGGIGMSALARFYVHAGHPVTGSDRSPSLVTDGLEALGVVIDFAQAGSLLSAGDSPVRKVVYTEAMAKDHPEMLAARALGVPMVNYFDALGEVANEYYLIAVAGTHGKTTTTAMAIDILEAAGLDPTAVVGSLRAKTKSNFRAGKSKYAIVEACEYKRDFLSLQPDVLVITNLEWEHVDYYKDLADVQSAFRELALRVPEGGAVIANVTDPNLAPVLAELPAQVVDYRQYLNLTLPLQQPGLHNRQNAAAATAVAQFVGVPQDLTDQALAAFAGTWRRFEYKGEVTGSAAQVPVIDDYGHHPTEVRATFAAMRERYRDRALVVVFQSHTYSRTHELFAAFAEVLATADQVFLLPIYAAREENTSGVSSEQLAAAVVERGGSAVVVPDPVLCGATVRTYVTAQPDAAVLVIGAGPVTEVADELTK